VKTVVISDISRKAAELTMQNVKANNLSDRVIVENQDANKLLSCHGAPRRRFDVVNIDPFGSPVRYIDSAIRALRNNGLLALTATDMAPLCGVHPRACIRKYGGKPLRTEYCHELAIRLLAGCLALTAAKHDIGTKIMFSHCSDHYVRVYAMLHYGAKKADEALENMGYVQHCFNCLHREAIKTMFPLGKPDKCVECQGRLSFAGPLWLGPICDEEFSKLMEEELGHRAFKNEKNIRTLLALTKEESNAPQTYYVVDKLSSKLGLPVPPVKLIIEKLRDYGFRASLTHFHTRGIKSDASAESVKRVLREIVSRNR
jgi:tRNA (guanine26-N2/guanine27-N2)-dimethyltransferase